MTKTNPFKNIKLEFHILQSFPVSCLNRDDVGSPKTAMIGGSQRARVSSQCWKREIRRLLIEQGISHGTRTKLVDNLISKGCREAGASEEAAEMCGKRISEIFGAKKEKTKKKKENEEETPQVASDNDTLTFLSPNEVKKIVDAFKQEDFKPGKGLSDFKQLEKILDADPSPMNAVDIALFGRMIAKAANMNVEAAASFSHAISTHKIGNEVEFFSAIDDFQKGSESAHLGTLEYNSATYYRYVCLNLGQLWETLQGVSFNSAVEAFMKALFVAVPVARQTTFSARSPWDYARVFLRKGQALQVPFETAVRPEQGGFLLPSKTALNDVLKRNEALYGSLFGKIAEFTIGEDLSTSIDDLIDSIQKHLK